MGGGGVEGEEAAGGGEEGGEDAVETEEGEEVGGEEQEAAGCGFGAVLLVQTGLEEGM